MVEKVLVVDDERSITSAIAYAFRREGYDVETAYDGEEALNKIQVFDPKIVILDVMLPKMSGFDVCRKIQKRKGIGVILLTAKGDIVDKVLGLELGADDYVVKPFDMRELLARANSLIRRLRENTGEEKIQTIEIESLKIIPRQRKAILDGKELDFTPKEFDLLTFLLSNIDRVYTRDELLDIVWGMEYLGGTRTVDIHIQRLRKKLGYPYENLLQTVRGVGYKAIGELYES